MQLIHTILVDLYLSLSGLFVKGNQRTQRSLAVQLGDHLATVSYAVNIHFLPLILVPISDDGYDVMLTNHV